MESPDAKLIAAYLADEDEAALAALIERYLKPVYGFVQRMAGSTDAEDITQEIFVKVWKNLKKYRSGQSFKTWLYAIARNSCIDFLRKKKSIAFSDFENEEGDNWLAETLADPEPLPDETLARAQNEQLLENLLNQLSPLYREVLILHYNEHFTFEEIGAALGKPLNTVKSQHRRGLAILRRMLDAPKTPSQS